MTRDEFWRQIEEGYAENYDIENIEPGTYELPLIAKATMHLEETGYVLTRKAEMWSANSDEHVYFYSADDFTAELCERCIDFAYEDGMSMVDLENKSNHMCTRVVAIFFCDDISGDAVKVIKSCKLYKNFKMGLKGWLEVHAVGVSLKSGEVYHNRYGRETSTFYVELLHPEKRKKKRSLASLLKEMID